MQERLNLSELRIAMDCVLKHVEAYGVDSIDVSSVDFYWYVCDDDRYDCSREPTLCVGSLIEDLQSARDLARNKERFATMVNLRHLASILSYISYQLHPTQKEDI